MVTVDGQKMGKSLGNFITLKQVFSDTDEPKHDKLSRKYDALAVRQLILNSHYRSPIDFSDAALTAAQSGYDRITETVKVLRKKIDNAVFLPIGTNTQEEVANDLKTITEKFEAAMNDDLNTSVALSVIFRLVDITRATLGNPTLDKDTLKTINEKFSRLGGDVLGIVKEDYGKEETDIGMISELVKTLIEQRAEARAKMDFVASDMIRMKLDSMGIILEDKPGGVTAWRIK
jgi:cysteinyl-tRNA synthetase